MAITREELEDLGFIFIEEETYEMRDAGGNIVKETRKSFFNFQEEYRLTMEDDTHLSIIQEGELYEVSRFWGKIETIEELTKLLEQLEIINERSTL